MFKVYIKCQKKKLQKLLQNNHNNLAMFKVNKKDTEKLSDHGKLTVTRVHFIE